MYRKKKTKEENSFNLNKKEEKNIVKKMVKKMNFN